MNVEERIRAMLAPIIEREAITLYDIDVVASGPHQHLYIYIDRPGGVNLGSLETVSHQISALLDVEDVFASHYVLEVSSPGLTRKLTKEEHFAKSTGNFARVIFRKGFAGAEKADGMLEAAGGGKYRIVPDKGVPVEFTFNDVARARLDLKE